MNYNEAMKGNEANEWDKAVLEEHNKMVKYSVWTPVKLQDVPEGAKIITSTWAMK